MPELMTDHEVPLLCQRIREERERQGISQEEMARRLGMSVSGYRTYEHNREPRPARLRQIALALELDEEHFLNGGNKDDVDRKLNEILRIVRKLNPEGEP